MLPDPAESWRRWRGERVLVVGFGERTGLSVAALLASEGVPFAVSDLRPADESAALAAAHGLRPRAIHGGAQTAAQLEDTSAVILSPGVPRASPLVRAAVARGVPVWGDVDFLYPFIAHKPIAAITGTDGKTTTTALLGAMLACDRRVVVAGNIGVPVCACYREILACDCLVLELSSFMLEALRAFRADVATVLNLAEDHVDRYPSHAAYAAAKLDIVRHARAGDVFLQNLDDPALAAFVPPRARVRTTSATGRAADYRYTDGVFALAGAELRFAECALRGQHHAANILAAGALACELGADPGTVLAAARTFPGAPHRFSYLGRFGAIDVYDDSKATTVHAIDCALASLASEARASRVVLIVGGRDKLLDFTPLRRHARELRRVICYGEAGPRIARTLALAACEEVALFAPAVERALDACEPGDVLLLSPGCTSWDQFANYEERGAAFAALVRARFG